MTNFIQLGYLNNRLEKTLKPLTGEVLENLMTSERVIKTMAQISATTDKDRKKALKDTLPCALFQCQMTEDGSRPKTELGNVLSSGFAMHDWDHLMVDPRAFYENRIKGQEKKLGIVLSHITPSGSGLRMVTTMKDGEEPADCQNRIARFFSMEYYADCCIKDLTRLSFIPSKDYLLYIDQQGLFARKSNEVKASETTPVASETKLQQETQQTVADGGKTSSKIAEEFTYEGISYASIIKALLKRIATQGSPMEGERNSDLFTLVRELRHICEYSFDKVYMLVAPYFSGLKDNEIRRTIASAIGTNGRTITPVLKGVLSELKSQNMYNDESTEVDVAKLPRLSAVEEMIISKYPKNFRSQVFKAMLPLWGLYGTHVRFDYLDGRTNSLSFMTAVVGKSGSGKAFAADLNHKMTKRFREEDAEERLKADNYLNKLNTVAEGQEKPADPRPKVRLYGDDITTSQLLDYLSNLNGEHGLQFTEEVARLQKAKRMVFGDNDDLYCKSFDNGIGGKESKSKLTRNIRIPIFLNTLFCGTPGAMHKFYNNPEGGLNNRIIYAFMPTKHMKGFPKYEKFTEDDQRMFDEVADRLWKAGQDGEKVKLPWLDRAVMMIKTKWDKEDEDNPNEVWYDLGKRSLTVAYRVGVLEWLLRDCPNDKRQIREIGRVVRWMAEAMRQGVYAFSGEEYEKIEENNTILQQQAASRMTKNKKLLSLLADTFTTQDVVMLRLKNGDSDNVRMVISRWKQDGKIIETSHGNFKKTSDVVA